MAKWTNIQTKINLTKKLKCDVVRDKDNDVYQMTLHLHTDENIELSDLKKIVNSTKQNFLVNPLKIIQCADQQVRGCTHKHEIILCGKPAKPTTFTRKGSLELSPSFKEMRQDIIDWMIEIGNKAQKIEIFNQIENAFDF